MGVLQIRDTLLTVTDKTYHWRAPKGSDRYIVWSEGPQSYAEWADNQLVSQVITGLVNYYTAVEYDPAVDAIQTALSNAQIPFRLIGAEYIDEFNSMHYQWSFEVICGPGEIYSPEV